MKMVYFNSTPRKVRTAPAAVPSPVPVVFSVLVEIVAAISKARADLDILRISQAAEGAVAASDANDADLDLAMRRAVEALDDARQWTANAVSKRFCKDFARGRGRHAERAMRLFCDYLDNAAPTHW
jgi:hypothetical protein